MGQLVLGDVQTLGKLCAITGSLIEHHDKLRVFKDAFYLTAGQQVLYVLRDSSRDSAPLSETLPDFNGIGGGLRFAQQQMELVDVVPGGFLHGAVDGYAVPHLILHDEHPQLFELLAQLLDVKADEAVVQLYVRPVVEYVQGASDIQFQRRCHIGSFRLAHPAQFFIQIAQDGHLLRHGIGKEGTVDLPERAVDDTLFLRPDAFAPAKHQLAQGKHKVGFQAQRFFLIRIIEVQIKRIDVIAAGGRNTDDLAAEALHQRVVFALRIADEHIVLCDQQDVGNLSLGREGFTGTGCAENDAVGRFQLLAIRKDHIVGQRIEAVVQRLSAVVVQFLRNKGHEDRKSRGRNGALDLHWVIPQRHGSYHSFLLLIVQRHQLTQLFLRDALGLQANIVQLLARIAGVHHQESQHEHALVVVLQVLQHLAQIVGVGVQIAGQDVDVVARSHSLFLFVNLAALQIADLAFHQLDRLHMIQRANMHGDDLTGFQTEQLDEDTVIQLRGKDLQETHRRQLAAHVEAAAVLEVQTAGRDEVLGGQPRGSKPLPVEHELRLRIIHMEHGMHQAKAFLAIHGFRPHAQAFQMVEQVQFDMLQPGLGCFDVVRLDAKGQVLGALQSIVAFGHLIQKHLRVLLAHIVKAIVLGRDDDRLLKGGFAGYGVHKGKLEADAGREVIEHIAPGFKDGLLILILRQLVVDIEKLNGFGVIMIGDAADTIRPHSLIRNGLLGGLRMLGLLCLRHDLGKLLFLSLCQFHLGYAFAFAVFGQCG